MTTTEPSRAASPVPSTSSSPSQAPCSAWPPLACLQRRKEKLCRTDLPVRSAPGVWLLVGVGVVLVGMCVAVAGYASASSAPKPLQGGRGTSHSERMKLAGPVVMGVGLFIFICSATLLYENRDSALLTLRPAGPGDGAPVLGDEEEGCSPRRPCCSCRDRRHRPHRRCSGDPEQGSWASSLSLAPSLCGDHSDEDGCSKSTPPLSSLSSYDVVPVFGVVIVHRFIQLSDSTSDSGAVACSSAHCHETIIYRNDPHYVRHLFIILTHAIRPAFNQQHSLSRCSCPGLCMVEAG